MHTRDDQPIPICPGLLRLYLSKFCIPETLSHGQMGHLSTHFCFQAPAKLNGCVKFPVFLSLLQSVPHAAEIILWSSWNVLSSLASWIWRSDLFTTELLNPQWILSTPISSYASFPTSHYFYVDDLPLRVDYKTCEGSRTLSPGQTTIKWSIALWPPRTPSVMLLMLKVFSRGLLSERMWLGD